MGFEKHQFYTMLKILFWSILFVSLNIGLNIYMKWLFQFAKFTFPITILCAQQLMTAVFLFLWRLYRKETLLAPSKKAFSGVIIMSVLYI